MAHRSNHYEAAFEAFLQNTALPYVAVDEQRRAQLGEVSLKSVDFIVRPQPTLTLLIDVKGRRTGAGRRRWENWVTLDDIASLMAWRELFGQGTHGLLLFAYADSAAGVDESEPLAPGSDISAPEPQPALFFDAAEQFPKRDSVPVQPEATSEPATCLRQPLPQQFHFHGRRYRFFGVEVGEYQAAMTRRSPRWSTYSVRSAAFDRLKRDIREFFHPEDMRRTRSLFPATEEVRPNSSLAVPSPAAQGELPVSRTPR